MRREGIEAAELFCIKIIHNPSWTMQIGLGMASRLISRECVIVQSSLKFGYSVSLKIILACAPH